jgi:Fe-S-cluster containining protein
MLQIAIRREKGKTTFLAAAYEVFDELTAYLFKKIRFFCHAGCNLCCHQPVLVSPIELGEIKLFVDNLDQATRSSIESRFLAVKHDWLGWIGQFRKSEPPTEAQIYERWKGHKCFCLNLSGRCDIYPVRPIVCRLSCNDLECVDYLTLRLEDPLIDVFRALLDKIQDQRGLRFPLQNLFEENW